MRLLQLALCVSLTLGATIVPAGKFSRRALEEMPGTTFESKVEVSTPSGFLVKRVQLYQGIPVIGVHSVEHLDNDHNLQETTGSILDHIPDDIPDVTADLVDVDALLEPYDCAIVDTDEVIEVIDTVARLVWKIACMTELTADEEPHRWRLEFNAQTGELIRQIDAMDHVKEKQRRILQSYPEFEAYGGNVLTGRQTLTIRAHVDGDTCTFATEKVDVVNQEGSTSYTLTTPWSFPCADLPANTDEINGGFSPLNDAMAYGEAVYDMFHEWYDHDALPFKLSVRVHYSTSYDNAFWNGHAMFFGDGANYFHPLVSLSVLAHEVSHGFTDHYGGDMVYAEQSGGINEAFSDMSSAAAEQYFLEETDYLIGDGIIKNGGALRYMCDPPQDGSSIGHIDDFHAGMDVHYSSGIYNKMFCILSKKDNWDARKSFNLFLRTNLIYWDTDTGFAQGAEDAVRMAGDLEYNTDDVCDAWQQVGILVGVGCGMTYSPTDTPTPPPTRQCDAMVDVKLVTRTWAVEITWDLDGYCGSSQTYSDNSEYEYECCVMGGDLSLACIDSYGDGWHGGYLEIDGNQYCGDFTSGGRKDLTITVVGTPVTTGTPESTTPFPSFTPTPAPTRSPVEPPTEHTTMPPQTTQMTTPQQSTQMTTPQQTSSPSDPEEPTTQPRQDLGYDDLEDFVCGADDSVRSSYWDSRNHASFDNADVFSNIYMMQMSKNADEQSRDGLDAICESICNNDPTCAGFAVASDSFWGTHWDENGRGYLCATYSNCYTTSEENGNFHGFKRSAPDGVCGVLTLNTVDWARDISWSLEGTDCHSDNARYSDGSSYDYECCLAPAAYTLNCEDAMGDGWHNAQIVIDGRSYCGDFSEGSSHLVEVNWIGTMGGSSYTMIAASQGTSGMSPKFYFLTVSLVMGLSFALWKYMTCAGDKYQEHFHLLEQHDALEF